MSMPDDFLSRYGLIPLASPKHLHDPRLAHAAIQINENFFNALSVVRCHHHLQKHEPPS